MTNPDDPTLRYYPFKATSVTVEPKPGPFGWYMSVISVLLHVKFEGMDVELRLEAAWAASDPGAIRGKDEPPRLNTEEASISTRDNNYKKDKL